MGLYICHLDTVTIKEERSLYIYLLDYGWPDGKWEKIFKKHFMKMADLASETGAVVMGSPKGVHFANEVLSYYRFGDMDVERHLPGLLITKTHPAYFNDHKLDPLGHLPASPNIDDLFMVPLEPLCTNETDFLREIEGIFSDLRSDKELSDYSISKWDFRRSNEKRLGSRIVNAIELKPGIFGFRLDIRKFFENKSRLE